jgi:hypothetical protein
MSKTEKLELRIKALELAVDIMKRTGKFTNDDLLELACYLYDFLDDDIRVSCRKLGLYK